MNRIVVTGMGIITPIGDSVQQNRDALKAGKSGISKLESIETKYAGQLPFGEVKTRDEVFRRMLNITNPKVNRTSLLALYAINEAIKSAGWGEAEIKSNETVLIGGNTVGGMRSTLQLYNDANANPEHSPFLYDYDNGSVNIFLQNKLGVKGIVNTLNTACSSSANAISFGARLLRHGFAKRAIVGGADCLAKFTINGFNALHILSDEGCRPFDKNRKGLNLGEGAAYLILEKEEDCEGKKVLAEVKGWSNTNDAFHPSSLSENGEGPFRAMKEALENAQLIADQIDFINAHGTGTENNDEVESWAILRLFENPPPFVSSKSNIGHTLGASGAVEAAYCILSLQHRELYPSLNFEEPIESTGLIPQLQHEEKELNHVMSNSFGFGGNCSTLIFSKP